jgi:hypothetical protein
MHVLSLSHHNDPTVAGKKRNSLSLFHGTTILPSTQVRNPESPFTNSFTGVFTSYPSNTPGSPPAFPSTIFFILLYFLFLLHSQSVD